MKIVVFSDIHGNILTLNKMLIETNNKNIIHYFHCGDIFGYFKSSEKVIRKFIDNKIISVKGNHDLNSKNETNLTSQVLFHDKDIINYLYSLQEFAKLKISNYEFIFFHGSPTDHLNGRIYPSHQDYSEFDKIDADVIFFGHTHYRMYKKLKDKILINPGSLGLPRDGNGFSYIIYDTATNFFSFEEVKLDESEIQTLFNDVDNKEYLEIILKRYKNANE